MFTPFKAGEIELANRIVMAPLTRSRAQAEGVVGALQVEYYGQRASAGLIISEGTSSSADGLGYARTPGLYSEEQIEAWRKVTDAVHGKGGKIFVQLMHTGRIGHPLNKPAGTRVVGPSAIAAPGDIWTDAAGMQPMPVPHELSEAEIAEVVREFGQASRNAQAAGFDGIELHAANGYLPSQFLSSNTNQRTDAYGGSVQRRARFVLEVYDALAAAWSNGRVGVRVSPGGAFNYILDADPIATHTYLASELGKRNAAFLHVIRQEDFQPADKRFDSWQVLKEAFGGTLIANGGIEPEEGKRLIESGAAELVSFGRAYISNPDLPARIKNGWQLAAGNPATFYTPGSEGYSDYPAYAKSTVLA